MIDQAECLLAVLGMRPIISHEIEAITDAQWKRVMWLEREIDSAARSLVRDKTRAVSETDGMDYMQTLRDLSTAYQPHQVEAMLSKLPAWFSDSSVAFLALSQNAFSYLGSQLPRQVKVALTGPSNLHPPARMVDRFVSLLEVLDDPVRALELAANAQLLAPQIAALDVVFPQAMDYMRKAIAKEISEARGESDSFQMHYHAEMGAEKLLGHDLTSPILRSILQAPSPAMKPTSNGPAQSKGDGAPKEQMTRVQRTDNIGTG